ncbi:DUF1289 domain-containing protein [Thalassotalea atypica]|uniref:DUF1289 domain-containing protein n=1 Tax=Thalassotalea atypica TaxID=2054316 RepID=UPI002573E419|nr:DUF1289 domain-containing protein [Thalassotalea atypica]
MQLEFFDVPSPCVGVCQSDEKGLCKGCYRSRDERQNWIHLNSDDKQKVIKRCIQRRKRKNGKIKPKAIEQVIEVSQPSLLDPPSKTVVTKSDDMDFGDFEL